MCGVYCPVTRLPPRSSVVALLSPIPYTPHNVLRYGRAAERNVPAPKGHTGRLLGVFLIIERLVDQF
jgi:hypothetical protein